MFQPSETCHGPGRGIGEFVLNDVLTVGAGYRGTVSIEIELELAQVFVASLAISVFDFLVAGISITTLRHRTMILVS